jgi:flagellar protein FlbD
VILLTQLNGDQVYVNANLIETVEGKPDTVISLTNAKKLMVRESPEQVVGEFIKFAGRISVSRAANSEELQWI